MLAKVRENQLDKNYKDLNKLQSENKGLRDQINVMRKEQKNQQRVNGNYSKEMKGIEDKALKLNNVTYNGQRMSEELNNQILSLKAKNEDQKNKFQNSIKELQQKLREKDDTELEKAKTQKVQGAADSATATSGEFSNPAALLKLRLQKWTNNNKEKKNLMDMYIRNVNIIEDAFNQIQQQTGIGSIEEIVTTFIKADEQNYSLYNYVNQINSEIDMIEEQNKQIEEEIQSHEKLGELTEKEKENVRNKLQKQIEESDALAKEKDNQIKNIETQLMTIKNYVWNMVENFKKSHFFLSVAQNNQYDESTVFNENNVVLYLAELEEYISLFITYMAYKQENPDAAIASLSLDRMAIKEFDKQNLQIDAPMPNDINERMVNEDLETEDEITADPRQLYKRFEDMFIKEQQNA